jgi:predicted SnoaL-like aldol condensation-catalyzing enzyme
VSDRQERNKQTALDFYDHVQPVPDRRRHREVRRHTYIQHNPQVADGKQAFIDYFVRTANDYPGKRAGFKRAFADGNHVMLRCHHI